MAGLPLLAHAETTSFTATTTGFKPATTLDQVLSGASLDFLVSTAADASASTHILVTDLMPVGDSDTVYEGEYTGVTLSSGATADTGKVVLKLDAAVPVPSGSVSSPIVGIIPRAGAFPEAASLNPLDAGEGESTVNTDTDTIALSFSAGGSTYTGNATYTVKSQSEIELSAFALTDGTSTWQFEATTFERSYATLTGFASLSDASASADMAVTKFVLNYFVDKDTDMVPDFMDSNVGEQPTLTPDDEEWVFNPNLFRWFYNNGDDWTFTDGMSWFYTASFPWIYSPEWGWVLFGEAAPQSAAAYLWIDELSTWVYTKTTRNQGEAKFFYAFEQQQNGSWRNANPDASTGLISRPAL
ncbi:MAG: hypothetical protein Q7P63_14595 [Verrucomicrobiota bacterium JB022]|nr:hypothetical protein [Verrucomicrobiota bacterium JB022]